MFRPDCFAIVYGNFQILFPFLDWKQRKELARLLFLSTGENPVVAKKVVRRIKFAAFWARKKARRREKIAQGILEQQKEDLEWLQGQACMLALAGDWKKTENLREFYENLLAYFLSEFERSRHPSSRIEILPQIYWPGKDDDPEYIFCIDSCFHLLYHRKDIVRRIIEASGGQPRLIRKAIVALKGGGQ